MAEIISWISVLFGQGLIIQEKCFWTNIDIWTNLRLDCHISVLKTP